jgi:hypothetical protein
VTNRAVSRSVHIAGVRPLRFSCWSLALALATLTVLSPRPLHAQPLIELPDSSPAADTAPASAAIPSTPPVVAPSAHANDEVLNAQVGTRVGLRAQNPMARQKINDAGLEGEADVVFWGQVHPFLKWQAGFVGAYGPQAAPASAALLDLVAKLEFAEFLNLWLGRMPIPSDRASLSTVWAITPWTMPGTYSVFAPFATGITRRPAPGPRRGENGRGDGATLWGQIAGGTFKYYLGVFGLGEPVTSPLYSARLAVSLLGPEPGFRTSSANFGGKDILALGVGVQHRAGDSRPGLLDIATPASDFDELNVDLIFETGNSAAGVLNLECSFAKLWGDNELASYQLVGQASYLMPVEIGIGKLQPLVRIQHAGKGNALDAGDFTSMDAQLGYIIDGFRARVLGVYQYAKVQGQTENSVLLGVQLMSPAK